MTRTRRAVLAVSFTALAVLAGALPVRAEGGAAAVTRVLSTVDQVIDKGPYAANWESLEKYQVPGWYLDAKFGIFIHWGPYAVPAFGNEWYPREMYSRKTARKYNTFEHHVAKYGRHDKFGYKDFIPRFKAERFDPAHWASVFKKSGAKYVVPVAEHHDGFAMYDTALSDWSAAKMGPRRDLVGDLVKEVRKQGLHVGLSSHRAEHWWFFHEGTQLAASDVKDPRYAGLYGPAQPRTTQPDSAFLDDWLARTTEMVDRYKPELIWFDGWIEKPAFKPYVQKFAAFYYNRGAQWKQGVAINYKNGAMPDKAGVLDIERGKLDALRPYFWQTDTSVCKRSWGYIENHDYKAVDSIVDDLVDVVSKNGSLLLNIGPRADGVIPEPQEKMLLEIGRWLAHNGEAIYGTRPWKVYGEGPTKVIAGHMAERKGDTQPFGAQDIRFTTKGSTLYAVALAWPDSGQLTIKALADVAPTKGDIRSIELLGARGKLKWKREAHGLTIELPRHRPGDHAHVFKITGRALEPAVLAVK